MKYADAASIPGGNESVGQMMKFRQEPIRVTSIFHLNTIMRQLSLLDHHPRRIKRPPALQP